MIELSEQEKIAFVTVAIEHMARHTHPFLLSVSGALTTSEGEFIGSGFRFRGGMGECVVSAAHVLRQAADERFGEGPAISAGYGFRPLAVGDAEPRYDNQADLVAMSVPRGYPIERLQFWPRDRVDADPAMRASDYLFVHGYPEKQTRFSTLLGGLVASSLPYGVMERNDDLPRLESWEFAMDFDPSNMLRNGEVTDLIDPHGLSGSPVFRLGAAGLAADHWSPECARLVGIVTKWNAEKRVLIATSVARLLELSI